MQIDDHPFKCSFLYNLISNNNFTDMNELMIAVIEIEVWLAELPADTNGDRPYRWASRRGVIHPLNFQAHKNLAFCSLLNFKHEEDLLAFKLIWP